MNNPTQEQIKEFWEWCGFKPYLDTNYYDQPPRTLRGWIRDGEPPEPFLPPLDLNNLFRYAAPKLIEKGLGCTISQDSLGCNACTYVPFASSDDGINSEGKGTNPALALFWAIWEVIHNDK